MISLLILFPLWLAQTGFVFPHLLLYGSIDMAMLLGVFLARIAWTPWWLSGIKSRLIALDTAGLMLLAGG